VAASRSKLTVENRASGNRQDKCWTIGPSAEFRGGPCPAGVHFGTCLADKHDSCWPWAKRLLHDVATAPWALPGVSESVEAIPKFGFQLREHPSGSTPNQESLADDLPISKTPQCRTFGRNHLAPPLCRISTLHLSTGLVLAGGKAQSLSAASDDLLLKDS
jgi:hypothetical protein